MLQFTITQLLRTTLLAAGAFAFVRDLHWGGALMSSILGGFALWEIARVDSVTSRSVLWFLLWSSLLVLVFALYVFLCMASSMGPR